MSSEARYLPERQPHIYARESFVYYKGLRWEVSRCLWDLRGRPVYNLVGLKDPVKESELSLEYVPSAPSNAA